MADGNPFAPAFMNPNASRTGLWDLRMMAAANRAEAPFMRGSHWGRQGIAGDPMIGGLAAQANMPDYSAFTYDPQMRAQAIAAGVQPLEASQVKQNTFLPNTGFFGNHPRLSAALEGGVYSALASHGGDTPGESIQGALEGLVGGRRIRQGIYNQQFAKPFESNEMLEHLRDMQANRQFREAQVKHLGDESEIQQRRIDEQHWKDQFGIMKAEATRPWTDPVKGQSYVWQEGTPPSFGPMPKMIVPGTPSGWHPLEGTGPGKIQRAAGSSGAASNLSMATREQLRIMGIDNPMEATQDQIAAANKAAEQQKIRVAAGTAGAGAEARIPAQNFTDARAQHDKRITEFQGKMLKQDDPQHQEAARQTLMMQWLQENQEARANNQPLPHNNLLPTRNDIQTHINGVNDAIQRQIDAENASFNNQWGDQASRRPPEGNKRQTKGTKDDPHIR